MVHGEPIFDSGDDSDDFVAIDLHGASHCLAAVVMIGDEALCGNRVDQFAFAAYEARGMRRAHVLRPERYQISRLRAPTEIVQWVYLRACVRDCGGAARARDGDRVFQRDDGVVDGRLNVVGYRRGARADDVAQVGLGRSSSVASLDERRPRQGIAAVEHVAVPRLDDDLILHAGSIRQASDLLRILARHARRDTECLRGRSAGSDIGGLDAQDICDEFPRLFEEILHLDGSIVRPLHRLHHLAARRPTAQLRSDSPCVDDAPHSQPLIYVDGIHVFSSVRAG